MPLQLIPRPCAQVVLAGWLLSGLWAHASSAPEVISPSAMDGRTFYEVLLGEMEWRSGRSGSAYELIFESAQRNKDESLFRRSAEIALQARAGEQALAAISAWRQTQPESMDALRYQVQLLFALNRSAQALEPLNTLLRLTPVADRPVLISALPAFFARNPDQAQSAKQMEQVLAPYVSAADSSFVSHLALARIWLAAKDGGKAFAHIQLAHQEKPKAEGPVALALELMPTEPLAETLVTRFFKNNPQQYRLRLGYVRSLTQVQRYADAASELEAITAQAPRFKAAWLALGGVQLELRRPVKATAALTEYLRLAKEVTEVASSASGVSSLSALHSAQAADSSSESAEQAEREQTQARFLLAQAAEQQSDWGRAQKWLNLIDDPKSKPEVQAKRAVLMARQGKLPEARALILALPDRTPEEARIRFLAEVQMLRELKLWSGANEVLTRANQRFADDTDLLYEQAMVLEKLQQLDEMEKLLRKVMALKPDYHHAYNALGYSLADRNVRLPEARTLIKKALDLSPSEPFITDSLAWVEFRLGNLSESVRLLRSAYKSRPDPEIAAHLGEVLWASGERDEAKQIWREGLNRDAQNEVLRETLQRLRVDL
jgi:tetratricopeptide (TPR) repeat protein